jgi:hypothetical protein
MSGGGIGNQSGAEDRQVVIFTFSGPLRQQDVDSWNAAIEDMLELFGDSLVGVTMVGAGKQK